MPDERRTVDRTFGDSYLPCAGHASRNRRVHLESNGRVAQQSLSAMTEKNGALAGGHIATISGPYLFDGFRPALVVNGNGCGHGYRADDAYPHRASACWVQPRDRFPRPAGVGVLAVSDANRGVGSRSCNTRL